MEYSPEHATDELADFILDERYCEPTETPDLTMTMYTSSDDDMLIKSLDHSEPMSTLLAGSPVITETEVEEPEMDEYDQLEAWLRSGAVEIIE